MARSAKGSLWRRGPVLSVSAAVIGLVVTIAVFGPFACEMWTQATLLPTVERRIGAEIRAPYVILGKRDREVITFSAVNPGGPAATAGVTSGDIVVEDVSIGELCRRLNAVKDARVVVEVAPGGNGPELDRRPHRKASILLP